ncbi:hypothetical protein LAX5112_00139 [Roseibium alexandrii]|uniref:Uncharacterized protein n=1 Tax=Roseibium alexandrii TaxID=388408 RepID=A0A0M6ZMK1_9HYPH|nr:hypothetical protein LAX5112_00139 [Roseibium alexandrii]
MAVFRGLSDEKSHATRSEPGQIHQFQTRLRLQSAQGPTSVSCFDAPQSTPHGHFPVIAVTYPGQSPVETGFALGETWSIQSCAQLNVLILFYFQSSAPACQHEAGLFYIMPVPVRDRPVPVRQKGIRNFQYGQIVLPNMTQSRLNPRMCFKKLHEGTGLIGPF